MSVALGKEGRAIADLKVRAPGVDETFLSDGSISFGMDKEQLRRKAQRTFNAPDGWRSRGYLPHFDRGGVVQFITIRLVDSLPQSVLKVLSDELAALRCMGLDKQQLSLERQRRVEMFLDSGYGSCVLRRDDVAGVIVASFEFLATQGHRIFRWVIMPNHMHILISIRSGGSLSSVMRSFKGWTGREANKLLGRAGAFWFPEYFDRFIRDDEHFSQVIRYIDRNPVKAGLVQNEVEWGFGSAGWKGEL